MSIALAWILTGIVTIVLILLSLRDPNRTAARPRTPRLRHQESLRELRKALRSLATGEKITVFKASDPSELLVRLTGLVMTLLDQHRVDEAGRCRRCRPRHTGIRYLLTFFRASTRCQVETTTTCFLTGPLDSIWWQAFQQLGQVRSLGEVRAWLDPGIRIPQQQAVAGRHAALPRHEHA